MAKIVISYRRADSQAIAGRIFDRLCLQFDKQSVFIDIDDIPAGIDFRRRIDDALSGADVMLVIVGRRWLGQAIQEEEDWVRIEVETALAKGLAIVPVLVDGARMPRRTQLPATLRDLAYRNAATVDAGLDFDVHMERLLRSINRIVTGVPAGARDPGARKTGLRRNAVAIGAVAGVALVAVTAGAISYWRPIPKSMSPRPEPAAANEPAKVIPPVLRQTKPPEPPQLQSAESQPAPGSPPITAFVPRPTAPPSPQVGPSPAPNRPNEVAEVPGPLTLGPASPPNPASPADADKIRRFIAEYDGGECFFIAPVAVSTTAAALEGLGASTAPFERFDRAFAREIGFEAAIGVRQVMPLQCPAVNFLAQQRTERTRAPRLQLAHTTVRGGEVLTGTLDNLRGRHVELLLISETGQVQNVSHLLMEGADAKTFTVVMPQPEGLGGLPQLIMAVASSRAIQALRPAQWVRADRVFAQVREEASREGLTLSAAARYFKLDR